MGKALSLIFIIINLSTSTLLAQDSKSYLDLQWKEVATRMPSEWYGTNEAILVAENVLFTQKDVGGWAKNNPYHHILTEAEKAEYQKERSETGATFDNGATITELKFLAKVYAHQNDPRYKKSFLKGLEYIFAAQYENGGWPQFYPPRQSGSYSAHITYNDNAMVNIMRFLRSIASDNDEFSALHLEEVTKQNAQRAFDKGVQIILKTQIVVDDQPTVWCAQHDTVSFAPADARKFELASFSGAESVYVTLLLMDIENPTEEIIAAVDGAVQWFENHKIEGIRVDRIVNKQGIKDKVVVADKNAAPLWARFYDLETGKPFFCGRDGIKRDALSEIEYERRVGYSWYTDDPEKIIKAYPEWRNKVQVED